MIYKERTSRDETLRKRLNRYSSPGTELKMVLALLFDKYDICQSLEREMSNKFGKVLIEPDIRILFQKTTSFVDMLPARDFGLGMDTRQKALSFPMMMYQVLAPGK